MYAKLKNKTASVSLMMIIILVVSISSLLIAKMIYNGSIYTLNNITTLQYTNNLKSTGEVINAIIKIDLDGFKYKEEYTYDDFSTEVLYEYMLDETLKNSGFAIEEIAYANYDQDLNIEIEQNLETDTNLKVIVTIDEKAYTYLIENITFQIELEKVIMSDLTEQNIIVTYINTDNQEIKEIGRN